MEVNEVNKPVTSNECTILLDAIHSNMTSVRAEIRASADYTNLRIDELTKRMDTQNGNVARLQELSNARQEVINDFRRLEKEARERREWPKRNWVYLVLGAIALVLVVVVAYDVLGLRGIIELAKGVR